MVLRTPAATVFALLGACLSVSGCGVPASQQAPSITPPPATPSSASANRSTLQAYFDALSASNYEEARSATRLAAPSSPAQRFARQQAEIQRAVQGRAEGQGWAVSTAVTSADSVDWAAGSRDNPDLAEFTRFRFDAAGRIADWFIDGSTPLRDAVVVFDRTQQSGNVRLRALSGYRTTDGALVVTYRARSVGAQESVTVSGYDYRGRTVDGTHTPYELKPTAGSSAFGFSVFPRAKWGGTLQFTNYFSADSIAFIPLVPREPHYPQPTTQEESPTP